MGSAKAKGRNRVLRLTVCVILLITAASAAVLFWSVYSPAGFNGALKVQNGRVVNRFVQPYVLQGVSTTSLQKTSQYLDKYGFRELKKDWDVNCIRLVVKTFGYDGYCVNDEKFRAEIDSRIDWGVRCATECGLYVIIDWHVLNDRNPNRFRSDAVDFFARMAEKYKDHDNVIFELCNEPNGDNTTWAEVREYADIVTDVIREKGNDALVIVGTPEWCRRITDPVEEPVFDLNTAYSLHFYAASHGEELRKTTEDALKAGLPVIVSEFGISEYDGNGRLAKDEGEKWLELLDRYDVGRICYCLKSGTDLIDMFKDNCKKTNSWESGDLSEYGAWIREQYTKTSE